MHLILFVPFVSRFQNVL